MFKIRHENERGTSKTSWLDSKHTFSFADYNDLENMGFSDLRVINDDKVAPGGGFGAHRHHNMEIISIVLDGTIEHKDSMGHTQQLKPGEVQVMSAGTGVAHSEFNPDAQNPLHFLQIWILPGKEGVEPRYDQKGFDKNKMFNNPELIVSGSGEYDSLQINQDVKLYRAFLEQDGSANFEVSDKRKFWIHIASGKIEIHAHDKILTLEAGDGLAVEDENATIHLKGIDKLSDVLIFDLRD
jgi:redox-sensitive bicupin YhaK (pirin superfamily)